MQVIMFMLLSAFIIGVNAKRLDRRAILLLLAVVLIAAFAYMFVKRAL